MSDELTKDVLGFDLFGEKVVDKARSMADFFIVPPFSLLDTTTLEWSNRKRRWNEKIGDIGQEREKALAGLESFRGFNDKKEDWKTLSVSILDAVLAEICIKWFTEEGFKSFDPFAGDTVFGFVSAYLKRPFTGIELRKEQADFNQAQCNREELPAKYICDDAANMDKHIPDNSMDFIFSCPPYADLEVYSDLDEDLSTMEYDDFFQQYKKILRNTYSKLKMNRFAVIVTSEVRHKKTGAYIMLVPYTVLAMMSAGYQYYNEIILLNNVGTLPLRVNRYMNSGRKVGRRHQNVLVFYKGDTKAIKKEFTEIVPPNINYEK